MNIMRSNKELLEQVITDTESIFGRIAENYPSLLGELEAGINKAAESIHKLAALSGNDSTSENLEQYLNRKKDEFNERLVDLKNFEDQNGKLIEKLLGTIKSYGKSQLYIDEIRDISGSLQVVSLNALVNAVKAGRGGEGFSVITDNLRTVTGTTIEKTGILERKGDEVQRQLERFGNSEQDISEHRGGLFKKIKDAIQSGITTFQKESEIINTLFKELNHESSEIKKSILGIMEELQQQDIIKQTIDQIILSIKEIPERNPDIENGYEITEEELDRAVFRIRLIELSVLMIDEITEQLNRTTDLFSNNFDKSEKKLEYIQTKKIQAVEHFLDNTEGLGSIDETEFVIREKTRRLRAKRQELILCISRIITEVEEISEEIESFEGISKWLNNVAVLSRIELSRSTALRDMKESVDDMAELVNRIQEQISIGRDETENFIDKTEIIFSEYTSYADEELLFIEDFTENFLKGLEQISEISNAFSGTLKNFNFFSEDFQKLFKVSKKELDKMRKLSENLQQVSDNLKKEKAALDPFVKRRTGDVSLREWQFADENLDRIIEKFTIYSHKRSAGDISGLAVEESVLETGEVTLF